jgi:23S rRNA (adenine2503-C2)-methyltransferase
MQLIYDITKEQLSQVCQKPFRAKQIYDRLYKKYVISYEQMNNVPSSVLEIISNKYSIDSMKIVKKESSDDGSVKYLFELHDGHTIETVLLRMKEAQLGEDGKSISGERYTICISSQVGCKIGCKFCFTAKGGFIRNLSAGEIVNQIVALKRDFNIDAKKSVNIVYMGMGEPLDNFENVITSIEILKDNAGLNLAAKRITVSTSGLSPKIVKIGEKDLGINIALSLHAVDDVMRTKLMPINKAYNIESILSAIKKIPINIRKKVMFEYLVIKDLNDDIASAKKLLRLLDGMRAKVNLILFNPHEGSHFGRPDKDKVLEFRNFLVNKGLVCTIRQSKGLDISAACGQLREKELTK